MTALIVIVILAVLGAAFVAWKSQHGPGQPPTLKPGPNGQQLVEPAQAPQIPGQGFLVEPGPGFVVVSRTDGQPLSPPNIGGANGPITTPTGFGQITQNLTAICKFSGKQVADCTCDRCKGIQKKGKVL